jgi:hypothetical protein
MEHGKMTKATKATDGRHHHHHIKEVIEGSHSTRTVYEDGHVKFETHWNKLVKDVRAAIADWEATQPAKPKVSKPRKKKVVE